MARDRDKIRQQVLENLGWAIARVWSTDWWYDPEAAIEQMSATLDGLLRRSREKEAREIVFATLDASEVAAGVVGAETFEERIHSFDSSVSPGIARAAAAAAGSTTQPAARSQLVAKQAGRTARRLYSRVLLADSTSNQDRFFDEDYSDDLRKMAVAVLESHGPIRDDVLAREVARAHGFARTGNRIKERVLELLPDVTVTEESVGTFLWPGSVAQECVPFRYPSDDGVRRSLDEIAMPELVGLVREHPGLAAGDDPALSLSREIGLARLARAARQRLEEALQLSGSEF